MRRARLTFIGAFHHCVNRGHGREMILGGDQDKTIFLQLMNDASKKMKIRVLAYCLMDNHYHLVIENSSGRMADFFKLLNGEYGTHYRRCHGGNGYVFQGRYKSAVIQDDGYLIIAISYVLANPVRARLANDFLEYPWSSAMNYFQKEAPDWVDRSLVEALYGTAKKMQEHVRAWQGEKAELPLLHTGLGPLLAEEEGVGALQERFERRTGQDSRERKRKDDFGFEPVEKIYQEFCARHKVDLEQVDFSQKREKRWRRQLLVLLKDCGGLKYREIARLPEFSGVKMNALGALYHYEKTRKYDL